MKFLLADDHALFLAGIKSLLESEGMEVAATASDGWEAIEKARSVRPDIILMDVQMPRLDGLAAMRLIKAQMPEVRVVMLTMKEDDDTVFEAIKSGASGYLLKTENTDSFSKAMLDLAVGEAPLSSGLAARILHEFGKQSVLHRQESSSKMLTPQQLKVLTLVSEGFSYKEVGSQLALTERTIKYHMAEIVHHLQLENRTQVLEYARRMGWVPGGRYS